MTAQLHERLIFENEETGMAFCPPLPLNHPRIVAVALDAAPRWIFSTACWRHYLGTWKIENDKFYLVALDGRYRLEGEEPLLADWFTGVLRVPQGEVLQYIHMGFASVYERELHINVERGVIVSTQVIDNRDRQPRDADLA
jgi:hypothetical protein